MYFIECQAWIQDITWYGAQYKNIAPYWLNRHDTKIKILSTISDQNGHNFGFE